MRSLHYFSARSGLVSKTGIIAIPGLSGKLLTQNEN